MAIVIEDLQIELLAQQIASAEGVSIAEVVRERLLSLAGMRVVVDRKPPLRERLATLAREVDAIPAPKLADTRSNSDVLGYNEHGIW